MGFVDTYTYASSEGGGKPLDPDFWGRFEHPPLVVNGKEVKEKIVVVVEKDQITIESDMFAEQRVYKHLTEKDDIVYEVSDDKTKATADVMTGTYEGQLDVDGVPLTRELIGMAPSTHIITVYYKFRHWNEEPHARLSSNVARGILKDIFKKNWSEPKQDASTTDEDHMNMVDAYFGEMHEFVHVTVFNRVVPRKPTTPISDDYPIVNDDDPVVDDDNPVHHPVVDIVPKGDGGGGGVLPLAVGGGAALILLLMVK